MKRTWQFLQALFLIPVLDRRAEQTGHRIFKYTRWYARFALVFFLVAIPALAIINVAEGAGIGALILVCLEIVLFPLLLRLVIVMNVHMNDQMLKEPSSSERS